MAEEIPYDLKGKVCLVTGASRGIGKGIALQLGQAGATVYITGRTMNSEDEAKSNIGGTLTDTAKEVEARGGRCIPIQCDHSDDKQVEQMFDRVKKEQNGQLDVLVNNAYSAVDTMTSQLGLRFWEQSLETWDIINNVGLRNHYLCSVHAAKIMVPRKQGLIVNISSFAGKQYFINAAYGIGKAAVDRMAADLGHELKTENVAFVSLWPGAVRTEKVQNFTHDPAYNSKVKEIAGVDPVALFGAGETPEYSGKAVVHLAADRNVLTKTGKVLIVTDLGEEYGFKDVDGRTPVFPMIH